MFLDVLKAGMLQRLVPAKSTHQTNAIAFHGVSFSEFITVVGCFLPFLI